jgi:NifU-like protein involved in Fe-S cluster formation
MSEAGKLYTPELLGLAVELAKWPPLPDVRLHGEARSPACGSTVAMDIDSGPEGEIIALGMRVRACAVGQAAAAIFARHAVGRTAGDLNKALVALQAWLAGEGSLPDWPDIGLIEAAQAFPGRHGAIQLPWRAALSALSSVA